MRRPRPPPDAAALEPPPGATPEPRPEPLPGAAAGGGPRPPPPATQSPECGSGFAAARVRKTSARYGPSSVTICAKIFGVAAITSPP